MGYLDKTADYIAQQFAKAESNDVKSPAEN